MYSNIGKVALYFRFARHNYVTPSVLNDMVCMGVKILQYFDPAIVNLSFRFAII